MGNSIWENKGVKFTEQDNSEVKAPTGRGAFLPVGNLQ